MTQNRIVLAYSGGLDTTVAVPWLKEKYGAEIITLTADLGMVDLESIRQRGPCHRRDRRGGSRRQRGAG